MCYLFIYLIFKFILAAHLIRGDSRQCTTHVQALFCQGIPRPDGKNNIFAKNIKFGAILFSGMMMSQRAYILILAVMGNV